MKEARTGRLREERKRGGRVKGEAGKERVGQKGRARKPEVSGKRAAEGEGAGASRNEERA